MNSLATDDRLVYSIRPMAEGDRALVISSWVRNYGSASTPGRTIDQRIYAREQGALVVRLLEECETWVAIDPVPAAPGLDSIHGFVCGERKNEPCEIPVVHYLWVRKAFRRRGVGKSLLAMIAPRATPAEAPYDPVEAVVYYTHIANIGLGEIVKKLAPEGIYNPYELIERERRR